MSPLRTKKTKPSVETAKPKPVSKKSAKPLTLKPRASEKAYGLSQERNTYIFDVEKGANKHDIANAVSAQYEVGVVKVRIISKAGKKTRSYRQRGRKSIQGKRSAIRKAYVTLNEGDKLPIFAAVEEPAAPKEKK